MENRSDLLSLSEQSYVVHRKDLPPQKDIKIKVLIVVAHE